MKSNLTVEEILNMPAGKEIDYLVAEKVMGWHIVDGYWYDSGGHFQHGVSKYGGYEDGEDFHTLKWHPSESILWAWEIIKEMSVRNYWFGCQVLSSTCEAWFLLDEVCEKAQASTYDLPLSIC